MESFRSFSADGPTQYNGTNNKVYNEYITIYGNTVTIHSPPEEMYDEKTELPLETYLINNNHELHNKFINSIMNSTIENIRIKNSNIMSIQDSSFNTIQIFNSVVQTINNSTLTGCEFTNIINSSPGIITDCKFNGGAIVNFDFSNFKIQRCNFSNVYILDSNIQYVRDSVFDNVTWVFLKNQNQAQRMIIQYCTFKDSNFDRINFANTLFYSCIFTGKFNVNNVITKSNNFEIEFSKNQFQNCQLFTNSPKFQSLFFSYKSVLKGGNKTKKNKRKTKKTKRRKTKRKTKKI